MEERPRLRNVRDARAKLALLILTYCHLRYDFRKPEDIPEELHHQFDGVVIDPPFITRDVCLLPNILGLRHNYSGLGVLHHRREAASQRCVR